jgi:hypothetical protein
MYDQFAIVESPLGTLYQCKSCRYNTFDTAYLKGHARSHKNDVVTSQVMESEEQPPETETPEAVEPPLKAPARGRRAKKEL